MDATARDSNQIQPADTNGLEDLFEGQLSPAQASPSQSQTSAPLSLSQSLTPAQPSPNHGRSVEEAAQLFGVSPRTIIRRLQKGILPGFKIQGQFGPEWQVSIEGEPSPAQASSSQPPTSAPLNPSQPQPSPSQSPTSVPLSPSQPYELLVDELRHQIEALKIEMEQKKADQQRALEGASFRIGYLEAQLDAERHQVKLLTDSQHKSSLWTKFKSWFLGAP